MIYSNLFEEILVSPASGGADELLIVSGYASGSMAYRHLATPEIAGAGVKVQLVVGMAPTSDGIRLADHDMFSRLETESPFECHYRIAPPAVHSKVYVWMRGDAPMRAFIGSANYTEQGFLSSRQENAMDETDPQAAHGYFMDTLRGAMEISHDDIEGNVILHRDKPRSRESGDCVTVSLLSRNRVPARSGLNWGQRPEYGRNPNQAYIQLGAEIARSGFFPPRPDQFTLLTDDGELPIVAVRAQKSGDRGGDAIETPEGNHILGAYLRARIGVRSGAPVAKSDLESYGRTDITFCKIEDDTYYMDFSV